MNNKNKSLKNIIITSAASIAAVAGLTYKIATMPQVPELKGDENIKYITTEAKTDKEYQTQIGVVRNASIDVLIYDKDGNRINQLKMLRAQYLMSPNPTENILRKPTLAEVINETSKDFPLGTVFIKIYDDAKTYQNSLR